MLYFDEPICYGRLLKRYRRFFMDVSLDDGSLVTAYTPNTGSMMGLLEPNRPIMLTRNNDPKRRCAFTAQAIEVDGSWVGINTHLPNKLLKASLTHPLLAELTSYRQMKSELTYGRDLRSRVDFYFFDSKTDQAPLYLEVKNVTLKIGDQAQFPDAISSRAHKHLEDLQYVLENGSKAVLLFVVQRQDCDSFSPAHAIDESYAQRLAKAQALGVNMRALCARIDQSGLALTNEIPIEMNPVVKPALLPNSQPLRRSAT